MLLSLSKAAERIGVHPDTLKGWGDAPNGPKFTRTAGGHRRYDENDLDSWKADQAARRPAGAAR